MMSKAVKRLERKLTKENLWMYIIKVLIDEDKPVRAYTVKKLLEKRYGLKIPTITIYTVIYRMTREGLLEKNDIGGDTLYSVTDSGREALEKAISILEETIRKLSFNTMKEIPNPPD